MLTLSGLKKFYFLPNFHDMRCKAPRVAEIVRNKYHRDPLNGDVYIFMSRNCRRVRMIHYENHAYYLHEKTFVDGYRFVQVNTDENGVKHEGGRGRNLLLDFLGDAKIKSQQSDGYNVYTYLDGELMDIEHLCCMDHFWAKAKKALNQGCMEAQFFVTEVGKLYRRERLYKTKGFSVEQIKEMRNDSYTQGFIDRLK